MRGAVIILALVLAGCARAPSEVRAHQYLLERGHTDPFVRETASGGTLEATTLCGEGTPWKTPVVWRAGDRGGLLCVSSEAVREVSNG